jgi:hypothetical protein
MVNDLRCGFSAVRLVCFQYHIESVLGWPTMEGHLTTRERYDG